MILEALEKIFDDHCGVADIRRIEAQGSPAAIWDPIEQGGFLDVLLPEVVGGAALKLADTFPIFECMGRFAMPLPIAQSMVVRKLLGPEANVPKGMLSLALQMKRTLGDGVVVDKTPYGLIAEHVLVADDNGMYLLPTATAVREPVGDPRNLCAKLTWQRFEPVVHTTAGANQLSSYAAAMASAMLSGAMQRVFHMTLEYANTRVQFGKSIGKFQAIQQQLATMAEHVLAGAIAAESAFQSSSLEPTLMAAAIAKSRASEASRLVAATSHAVHGAIGMTDEYELSLYTRRMHDWRICNGSELDWNQLIGKAVLQSRSSLADFVRQH